MRAAILILSFSLLASACSVSGKYRGVRIDTTPQKKEIIIKG